MNWKLGYEGFICQYMVKGPFTEEMHTTQTDPDPFRLDAKIRREIAEDGDLLCSEGATIPEGAKNPEGATITRGNGWHYVVSRGNGLVDRSAFYATLQKVEMAVSTVLVSPCDTEATLRIWSYMAVRLFVNGALAGELKTPVYKPIGYVDLPIHLQEGENLLNLQCRNLGVRDTRNIVGLQIRSCREELKVTLPEKAARAKVYEGLSYLEGLQIREDRIFLGERKVQVSFPYRSFDYEAENDPGEMEVSGEYILPPDKKAIRIRLKELGISRILEPEWRAGAVYAREDSTAYLRDIAEVRSLNRGAFGFAVMNILARRALGIVDPEDPKRMFRDLDLIEKRVDCAEFLLCGLIRYTHNYETDEKWEARFKEVCLHFRYWINMPGSDAMCFWSENHSLMFYSCMMFLGERYPEDHFTRALKEDGSTMTGRELSIYGRDKVMQWIRDVETYGYEEFLSATYTSVSFAALLNLVDYGDEEISRRVWKLCDRLAGEIALHTFRGTMIAPMGRVYRGVIHPYAEGVQTIVHLLDPRSPKAEGEGWLAYLATSKYRFPEDLAELMGQEADTQYSSGNALIRLKKTKDYCLTSVQSPRTDGFIRWENIRTSKETGPETMDTHAYIKSANESFHGTTWFEPGTGGYQQHLWYAALSGEVVLFVNHPGTMSEDSDMRPGYWHGSGVMPAVRQEGNMLAAIYGIPDGDPIGFTHVFFPVDKFEEIQKKEHWIFARKEEGYLALWCSEETMEEHDDHLMGAELRVYSRNHAYAVICGSRAEDGNFREFMQKTEHMNLSYAPKDWRLFVEGKEFLRWYQSDDKTQYI